MVELFSTTLLIVFTIAVSVLSFLAYKLIIKPSLSPLNALHGPKSSSLISGNLNEIIAAQPFEKQMQWLKETNYEAPMIHFRGVFQAEVVTATDPEVVKHVLVTNQPNWPKGYNLIKDFLGDGLVSLEGETHKLHRRIIQPAFHFRHIHDIAREIFARETLPLIEILQTVSPNKKLDLFGLVSRVTLNIIGKAGFDYDFKALESVHENIEGEEGPTQGKTDEDESLNAIFYKALASFRPSVISFAFGDYYKYLPTERNNNQNLMTQRINCTINEIIRKNRKKHEARKEDENEPKSTDILSLLFDAKDEETGSLLSDEELRDEMKTFIFAGHETTSTLLLWAFYCLARFNGVQEKVLQELDEKLGGRIATPEDVEGGLLPYLNAFFKEVLRMYPPVAGVSRLSDKDDEILGYKIPAGTRMSIPTLLIHHHPKWWDEPEEFQPERWLKKTGSDENSKSSVPRHAYAYLPFISGPRNCIGQKFALVEARIIAATILQKLTFTLAKDTPPLKLKTNITMHPQEVLKFHVHPRNI